MCDGGGEIDMAHPFTADTTLRYFDAALVTDNSPVANPFVFPAVAFPIFCRAEYPLAKQSIFFRFERSVVDGFRLYHFAMRPRKHDLRRGKFELQALKIDNIFHRSPFATLPRTVLLTSSLTFFLFSSCFFSFPSLRSLVSDVCLSF